MIILDVIYRQQQSIFQKSYKKTFGKYLVNSLLIRWHLKTLKSQRSHQSHDKKKALKAPMYSKYFDFQLNTIIGCSWNLILFWTTKRGWSGNFWKNAWIRLYRHLYEAYLPWLLRDQKACLMVRDTGMKWDIKTSSHSSSSWLKLEK